MAGSFAHLHVHTEYSMLDGAAKIGLLMTEAVRLGMPAVGMTDHGNMYGAYEFQQEAKKVGIKPVIGIEAYLAPSDRFHKKPVFWGGPGDRENGDDISGGGAYTHITMLAEDGMGLRNLFRLSSLASIEGYYYKPRMDRDLISRYANGIIATTGCPSGEVQTRLRLGQSNEALKAAADFRDIFGADNFFLELMDHGLEIERRVRDGLLDIGKKLNLRPLATNDSHYVTQDQANAHEALLCVQSGKTLDDPKRFKFDGDGYYLKSAEEMRSIWDREVPEACSNTLLVADRVQSYDDVFSYVDRTPKFDVPEGETQSSWLRKEVNRLTPNRYGPSPSNDILDRIDFELELIDRTGFPAYFLVVADICNFARKSGIMVGPGRGSATGSAVAYILGITQLDPLEHRLLFERFINPERVSPPDIDLDFDERRRGEMIQYVTDKYGDDRVCQILTFGTIKAKAAIKDSCRVLGFPYALGDKITKAMPPDEFGKSVPISVILDAAHPRYSEAVEVRSLYENDPEVRRIVDTARGLEGLTRGTGVHAAGVILSSEPLLDVLPIHRREDDGAIITGFPYTQCEAMGLLKMDFLGLRNLTVIDDAVKNIKVHRGVELNLDKLELSDGPTFEMMARGDTLGTFQLDGGAMRNLLKAMVPTKFEDIAAVLALYRPGPMAANSHIEYADRKNGRRPVEPIHPELREVLEEILGETYHLVVYQEQVMAIAQRIAGYSLGAADLLRRAMGKKKKEILEASHAEFMAGTSKNGYSAKAAQAVWDVLLPFSGYGFNKSHTAGYGIVSFWTAYLKANYPTEYLAALLTSVGDDKDKMAGYLAECRKIGIKVLPPDVNDSSLYFTPAGSDIRFGLGAIRNVGANVVRAIVAARRSRGRFESFEDFLDKVDVIVCNKRVVESLIKAGAFDSLGHTRRSLIACHESAVEHVIGLKRQEALGQYDLFRGMVDQSEPATDQRGLMVRVDDVMQEWDRKQLLSLERDMLGLYVSSHPLEGAEHILSRNRDMSVGELRSSGRTEGLVQLAGLISKVDRRINKTSGSLWAIATLEDLDAGIEVLLFPKTYQLFAENLFEDSVVTVRGRINEREGAISIFVQDLAILDVSTAGSEAPITLAVKSRRVNAELVGELKKIIESYPGPRPLRIRLDSEAGRSTLLALSGSVDSSSAFKGDIKSLLGAGSIVS